MSTSKEKEEELKRLRAAAGQCKAQVTRLENYVQANRSKITAAISDIMQLRIAALEKTLQQYQNIQLQLQVMEDKIEEDDFMSNELEDRYYQLCADIADLTSARRMSQVPTTTRGETSKLPRLELPLFSGDEVTKYKPFIELFMAVVDSDASLAPVQKLYYLKTHLKKDADALIEGLPLCDSSYQEALKLLKDRYDNPSVLIASHVTQILDYPHIGKGTASSLREFVSHVRQHLGALKNMDQQVDTWDMLLLPILTRKLDQFNARQYHMERDKGSLPTVSNLLDFLENRAFSYEESQKQVTIRKPFEKVHVSLPNVVKQKIIKCSYCHDEKHKLFACPKFKMLSVSDRISHVKSGKLCMICMNNHIKKCKLKIKCAHCKSKEHNTLLHNDESYEVSNDVDATCNLSQNKANLLSLENSTVLLPTIKMKVLCKDGKFMIARGLLDTGSQSSFISQSLATKLNLNAFNKSLNIVTLGQKSSAVQQAVNIKISNLDESYSEKVLCSIVNRITCPLPQQQVVTSALPAGLMLADDGFDTPGEIEVLLSADVFFNCIVPGQFKIDNGPLLMNTRFGWVVSGKINNACMNVTNNHCAVSLKCLSSESDTLSQLVERFWEMETIPLAASKDAVEDTPPTEEKICEAIFRESTTLLNGKFQVQLPLIQPIDSLQLGNSFSIAYQRLEQLHKRLVNNEELLCQYSNFLKEYIDMDHAKLYDINRSNVPFESLYFLPHHAVVRLDKRTTKVRVVFDGSAKTNANTSLNDVLYNGKIYQKDLFDILLKFRTYEYVFIADIKNMFRNIMIDPSQRHLQNIIWKEKPTDPVLCLQLNTVTYGLKSSSYLATRCLKMLADCYEDEYPLAAPVLRDNTYVDDIMSGSTTSVQHALEVTSPILVVELNLNRLEGTQLRALGLLSVFGFNMTYAVRGPTEPAGPTSCSAIECRLLGHCYASYDYKEFYCACFEGYSGADCGVGPLCPRTNMCKNAGTCRQMGPAAVSCLCERGFTGDFCESSVAAPECGIEECSDGCKEGRNCDCNPKDSDFTSARFETRLQIVDQAENDISQEIVKQITSYLTASNITLEDEIEILNISLPESNGARTVWLRVWGARREAGALRAALARLAATRTRTDRLRLLPATLHFDMQPALTLHTLIMNQRPEVWEGSEFILSCMAYGSPDILFAWYKDGIKVNFNGTTRDIWTRTVAEDALGRRMSVLGISEAKRPDSGRWSCSADDAGRKRCRALKLAVLRPPDIRLVPSALTVNKGDNVSITCLAVAGRMHGVLGFSWAREKTLLPMAPGKEVWEDLYPAGSVLKLYNVQKSGQYHCQVSSVAGTNSKGVTMWVLGPTDEACQAEPSHGIRWPKTAPGAHASAACPPGHSGETTRFCEPKTSQREVKWRLPDFSACVADSLKDIYEQFSRISYGYSWGNVTDVSHQYGAVLRSLPSHPGAGTLPLQHSRKMLYYLLSSAGKPRDRVESVPHLLKIYDTLLKHPDTFLDEEKIYELQNAIADAAGMRDNLDLHLHQFSVKSKPVRDDNAAHFKMQATPTGTEEWLLTSVGVELVGRNGNASVIAVQYHNLAARLPSLGRSIEFNGSSSRSGREMEFLVASPQAQLWAAGAGVDRALPHTVTLLFTHIYNYSAVASKLACGVRSQAEPRAWSTKACEVRVPEPSHVACRCRGLGTYALFTIARSTLTDAEKDLRGVVKITVGLGGAMCLAAAALQFLGLVVGRKTRLPVLLKVATAGSHSAALLTLLECDTRQEEACPGALGWVCAACWCAGCAALCAQPLLLQAELAGRTQRAPSVGLLAGVCTLAWLTARLWGGAPLQLGAAAQIVCAAGCALLALLCAALALCAALRLRTITHKVPAERRNYLADRTRVVRHTLVLLVTTSAAQAAGVAYAQPGERRVAHVAALSAAALANGLAMLVCYVIRDEECLRSAKRALSLGEPREWQDSPQGDTSLSLYIKQGGEVESRGGVLLDSPSPASPASYWRAPGPLDTPDRLHRRQSTPDSRADIVRCVEYKDSVLSPHRYERHARPVCDLIPRQPEYMARVRLELGVLNTPPPRQSTPLLTCSVDFEPYTNKRFDTAKENCTLCVQSNPDISKIPSPPIKSCLKKSNKNLEFASSISLPSMEILKDEPKSKSDIEQVNREWNRAYDSPETDRMLNKISNDLDFLLNRTQDANVNVIRDQIEEAPT